MKPILFFILVLTSCSVKMASDVAGTSIDTIQSTWSRSQMLAHGAQVTSSGINKQGQLIEVYRIEDERGSIARAFIHGCLDTLTLCFWELIGTPIETALDQKKYYSVRITYDENERIEKMELL